MSAFKKVWCNGQLVEVSDEVYTAYIKGDFVTPREIEYSFKLMFEDRSINIMAYNLETVLAEKFETVIARGVANTRMRDFYDTLIV